MGLLHKVEKIEDVAESQRGFYVKQEDGTFQLDVDGLNIPDVSKLNKALDEERKLKKETERKAKELQDKLAAYDGIDLEEVKKLQEESRKKGGKDDQALEFERAKTQLKNQYETQVAELNKKLEEANSRRLNHYRQTEIVRAINELDGFVEPLLPCVLPRIKVTEEGERVALSVIDENGEDLYTKDPERPGMLMTPMEYIKSLQEKDSFIGCFKGSKARGAGSQQSSSTLKTNVTSKKQLKTPEEKSAFIAAHGGDAYLKLPPE